MAHAILTTAVQGALNQGAGHIDEDAVPGTVHLVDLEGIMQAKHAKGKKVADVVLVPAPSSDPDDPLNWSKSRKMMSTIAMCVYIIAVGIGSSAIYACLVPISEDTGLSVADLNTGTGYMFLAYGWGCLFWQPLALQYGKRPVYIITLLLSCVMLFVQTLARSNGIWILCKVLHGFVGAPIESLGEISVADVYFSHERGTYLAVYACTLFGAGFFGPIIGGYINDGQGWRWVQYWCGIFCAVGAIIYFFIGEETNYDRAPLEVVPTNTPPEDSVHDQDSEKGNVTHVGTLQPTVQPNVAPIYKRKTYWQRLSLRDKPRPFSVHRKIWRPFKLWSFPVIVWCGFSYGCALIWYNVINATSSLTLASPPYNFSSSIVGTCYFATILGVVVALPYTGNFGDWVVLRLTRRNGGIWQAEQRLWLFLGLAIVLPFCLILWGVGAYHQVHWFGLIFAEFLFGIASTGAGQLSIAYLIDSYKDLSADAMVSVVLIRNSMSFAIGYGVTPWVTNLGYQNAYIVGGLAGMAELLTFLIMVKWGPRLRASSRHRYYRYVRESLAECTFQR